MDTDWNILGPAGLAFFSKITATTTHELNNAIGIINEQAGLLGDLGSLAKQDKSLDIDRWINISKKITCQVNRAHATIKNLNKFAHSTDNIDSLSNVDDLLSLLIVLSTRILSEKNVIVNLVPISKPVKLNFMRFCFLNLMGLCLIFARDNVDENKTITIKSQQKNGKLEILFSGLNIKNDQCFFTIVEEKILKALKAKSIFPTDNTNFIILIDVCK